MIITPLEVVFWFWSAGFMLDEVVGFNEQGFSLYLMSFWNTFDLGILLLLMLYYAMRIYGIFLVEVGRREWNDMAYDVLAANAILLFPRLFSVLDHYRYFSQLLIAFRLMAVDLVAVFILILIACSGFFVAFTMSFGNEYDPAEVAYRIFQILMGFTPAAWEAWPTYNLLGKAILVLFLFICHFLVVTILITVLTNSFMAIVSNANEEHQFVFAVNTISMVKNDALFSYVAPTNIFAWALTPLRTCLPFRMFIKLNRTVIKVTHFPLLFGIFAYEKLFLAIDVYEPTDLIENTGRGRRRVISFQENRPGLFSPNLRMRSTHQESIAGFQKDKALDEVFRLAPRDDTIRNTRKGIDRTKTLNVVNNWMDHQGGEASPPLEQDRAVVDRLEMRRQARNASMLRRRGISREISGTRSVASDPAEFMSTGFYDRPGISDNDLQNVNNDDGPGQTDADGDDELVTNDDDEGQTLDKHTNQSHISNSDKENESEEDYFHTPTANRHTPKFSSSVSSTKKSNLLSIPKPSPPKRRSHTRNASTATILFKPVPDHHSSSASPPKSRPLTASKHNSAQNTGAHTPASGQATGHRTPRHSIYTTANTKARPILPTRSQFQSVPNFNLDSALQRHPAQRQIRHRRSSMDMGMSDLGLNDPNQGMVPSSFATQMALATGGLKGLGLGNGRERGEDTDGMMGRLMLARMKTLEEGFAEVVREFRGARTAGNSSAEGVTSVPGTRGSKGKERAGGGKKKREGGLVRTRSEVHIGTLGRGGERVSVSADEKGKENQILPNLGGDREQVSDTPEQRIIDRYAQKGSSL